MRRSKFSKGISKVNGKRYQKSYIKVPLDFFVNCPYCSLINECDENAHIHECENCKKEFFAEHDVSQMI